MTQTQAPQGYISLLSLTFSFVKYSELYSSSVFREVCSFVDTKMSDEEAPRTKKPTSIPATNDDEDDEGKAEDDDGEGGTTDDDDEQMLDTPHQQQPPRTTTAAKGGDADGEEGDDDDEEVPPKKEGEGDSVDEDEDDEDDEDEEVITTEEDSEEQAVETFATEKKLILYHQLWQRDKKEKKALATELAQEKEKVAAEKAKNSQLRDAFVEQLKGLQSCLIPIEQDKAKLEELLNEERESHARTIRQLNDLQRELKSSELERSMAYTGQHDCRIRVIVEDGAVKGVEMLPQTQADDELTEAKSASEVAMKRCLELKQEHTLADDRAKKAEKDAAVLKENLVSLMQMYKDTVTKFESATQQVDEMKIEITTLKEKGVTKADIPPPSLPPLPLVQIEEHSLALDIPAPPLDIPPPSDENIPPPILEGVTPPSSKSPSPSPMSSGEGHPIHHDAHKLVSRYLSKSASRKLPSEIDTDEATKALEVSHDVTINASALMTLMETAKRKLQFSLEEWHTELNPTTPAPVLNEIIKHSSSRREFRTFLDKKGKEETNLFDFYCDAESFRKHHFPLLLVGRTQSGGAVRHLRSLSKTSTFFHIPRMARVVQQAVANADKQAVQTPPKPEAPPPVLPEIPPPESTLSKSSTIEQEESDDDAITSSLASSMMSVVGLGLGLGDSSILSLLGGTPTVSDALLKVRHNIDTLIHEHEVEDPVIVDKAAHPAKGTNTTKKKKSQKPEPSTTSAPAVKPTTPTTTATTSTSTSTSTPTPAPTESTSTPLLPGTNTLTFTVKGGVSALASVSVGSMWVASKSGSIGIHSTSGTPLTRISTPPKEIVTCINPTEHVHWIGTTSPNIQLYKEVTFQKELKGHVKGPIHCILRVNTHMWSISDDSSVCLWNAIRGKEKLEKTLVLPNNVQPTCMLLFGQYVWVGCQTTLLCIEHRSQKVIGVGGLVGLGSDTAVISLQAIMFDVWSLHSSFVQVWDSIQRLRKTILPISGAVCFVGVGEQVWFGMADRSLLMYNAKTGQVQKKIPNAHPDTISCLTAISTFDPVTRTYPLKVFSGSVCGKVSVWETGQLGHELKPQKMTPVNQCDICGHSIIANGLICKNCQCFTVHPHCVVLSPAPSCLFHERSNNTLIGSSGLLNFSFPGLLS
ncbi:hypothetical protein Pelo_16951 [Pelomyxa schiedti]|nr:hypothetical protein Pelo_16951 [Pelomyxa schiedti]